MNGLLLQDGRAFIWILHKWKWFSHPVETVSWPNPNWDLWCHICSATISPFCFSQKLTSHSAWPGHCRKQLGLRRGKGRNRIGRGEQGRWWRGEDCGLGLAAPYTKILCGSMWMCTSYTARVSGHWRFILGQRNKCSHTPRSPLDAETSLMVFSECSVALHGRVT